MIFKNIEKLKQIDYLIREKRTGNAESFAKKLDLSRRQVYNWINELRYYGLEISYDKHTKSFVYDKEYEVIIDFKIKELSSEELKTTKAGMTVNKNIKSVMQLHKHPLS